MAKNLLLVCGAILISFFVAEGAARLLGHKPFSYSTPSKWRLKVLESDQTLGWRNKPGRVEHFFLPDRQYPVTTTVSPDGARVSKPGSETERWAEFYGGSMGFGWGVTDGETAADKVSDDLGIIAKNYSVGGFGALQVLLSLEQSSKRWTPQRKPEFIVYQFATHHWNRASGEPAWLLSNERNNPRGGHMVGIPYARLDKEGGLSLFPATRYTSFPLRETFALVNLAEMAWVRHSRAVSIPEMIDITAALVRRMAAIAEKFDVPFLVAGIYAQESDFSLLKSRTAIPAIHWVNCLHTGYPAEKYKVPNDGHPNGLVHAWYGKCIRNAVRKFPGGP